MLGSPELATLTIQSKLRCKLDRFLIKYLGVFIRRETLNKRDWYPVIDWIERRLERWKVR